MQLRIPVLLIASSQDWTYNIQMIASLEASILTAGILNTFTRLWLTELEQATPGDSIKDVVRSSV